MTAPLSVGDQKAQPDLFRIPPQLIEKSTVHRALDWLAGDGPFPRPLSVHFDLTLRCNARCTHCRQWTWPEQPEMDLPQLERMVGVLREWGVRTVTLGGGNPLLHREIIPLLGLLRQAGIRVGIITEGARMAEALVEAIACQAEWVRFSIDGPTAPVHDRIRNTPGLFDQAIDNVRRLRAANPALNTGVNCVVQRLNLAHLDGMRPMAEAAGIGTLLFKLPHGHDPHHHYLLLAEEWPVFTRWVERAAGAEDGPVRTNLRQLWQLVNGMFDPSDAVRGVPVRTFYTANHIRCFVPFFFLVCDSRGDVYPCDYLQADTRAWDDYAPLRSGYRLGSILEDPDAVFHRLAGLMRDGIHPLPARGNAECGCCTRFAQLNAWLSQYDRSGAGDRAADFDDAPFL